MENIKLLFSVIKLFMFEKDKMEIINSLFKNCVVLIQIVFESCCVSGVASLPGDLPEFEIRSVVGTTKCGRTNESRFRQSESAICAGQHALPVFQDSIVAF